VSVVSVVQVASSETCRSLVQGILTMYGIECDQVQQTAFTHMMIRQESPDSESSGHFIQELEYEASFK